MLPIREIAEGLGINEEEIEYYGRYKAKLSDTLANRIKSNKDGRLVLVTAINPPLPERERPRLPSASVRQ